MKYFKYALLAVTAPEQFPIGSVIETIDGIPAKHYMENTVGKRVALSTPFAREYRCGQKFVYGKAGEKVALSLKNADGSSSTVKTSWGKRSGNWKSRKYEPIGSLVYDSDVFSVYMSEDKICHVVARSFETMAVFKEFQAKILPVLRESNGVILDLRLNSGGMTDVGKAILKCFSSEKLPNCQVKTTIKTGTDIAMGYIFGDVMRDALPSYASVYEEEKSAIDAAAARGRQMYEGKYTITEEQYGKIMDVLGAGNAVDSEERPEGNLEKEPVDVP